MLVGLRVDIRQRFRWNDWWLQKYSQVYRALKIMCLL